MHDSVDLEKAIDLVRKYGLREDFKGLCLVECLVESKSEKAIE